MGPMWVSFSSSHGTSSSSPRRLKNSFNSAFETCRSTLRGSKSFAILQFSLRSRTMDERPRNTRSPICTRSGSTRSGCSPARSRKRESAPGRLTWTGCRVWRERVTARRRPADCRAGLVLGRAVQREGGCSSHKAALKRGRPRSSPEPGGPGTGNVRVHDSVLMSTNRDPMITRRHAPSRVRIEKISDLSQVVWASSVAASTEPACRRRRDETRAVTIAGNLFDG